MRINLPQRLKCRMKCIAGLLAVECVRMLILIHSSDAGAASQAPCRLKELAALTRSLVTGSLESFDKANGKHLGPWPPGFPQLEVPLTRPPNGSKVQCSLLFMAKGLQQVSDDQRDDLNPENTALHEELKRAVSSVRLLAACAHLVLGGHCSQRPPPPRMPEYAFEKKQWSRTLLKTAQVYLERLQRTSGGAMFTTKGKMTTMAMVKKK